MNPGRTVFKLLVCVAVVILLSSAAEEVQSPARSCIEHIVSSYIADGTRDEQALADLASVDPSLGKKWMCIMDLWESTFAINDELPDDLPEDDTLCLVGLGYQLNPDGTMQDELIQRLTVLLAASEKYPHALIVCTGGGTASKDPAATEARRMAEWLEAHGVNPARLIVEARSLTTVQNAVFTIDILLERYPQVRQIAIISSDYHIATGRLLFGAEAILRDSDIKIVSNAAWRTSRGTVPARFQGSALLQLVKNTE